MAEIREPRNALAQGELEGRHGRERRPQPQNLQQLTGGAVGGHDTFPKAVGEERGFRMIVGRRAGHGTGGECNARTIAPDNLETAVTHSVAWTRRLLRPARPGPADYKAVGEGAVL